MKIDWKNRWWERGFLLVILVLGLFLFLGNLWNQYLWQDEAQTALISKTILTEFVPRGYDGKNYFSQEVKAEYGENYIWKWHTWLPFYVLAGFFKIFGINTFVARLPFALFGLGTVFFLYFLCRSWWPDKKVAVIATLLLLLCVPFLILSRQSRYYSMLSFFSLWGFYAYSGLVDKKKYQGLYYVLAVSCLFHTHYLYSVTFMGATCLHALLFHRQRVPKVLLFSVIVVVINLPWIVWFMGMKYEYGFDMDRARRFINTYLEHIFVNTFWVYLWGVIPLALLGNWIKTKTFSLGDRESWKKVALLLFYMVFTFIALLLSSPSALFRYLSPFIPLMAIILALCVAVLARVHILLALLFGVVFIITGSLNNFLYELTHDYDGPVEGIVKYLKENGTDDDVVAITYGDMPLKFYTNMRVVGGITGEDFSAARQAKWIIIRKYGHFRRDEIRRLIDAVDNIWIDEHNRLVIERGKFIKSVIDYPDIPFENRETPLQHKFRTVMDEDRVIILKRR
ncbi:MAG: glycosyltransferase family 39 protein [Sedimentisphaerales bacterium]|nr:glycosyltransferase family 39 protein [Sedimentisphaerales bacterium]